MTLRAREHIRCYAQSTLLGTRRAIASRSRMQLDGRAKGSAIPHFAAGKCRPVIGATGFGYLSGLFDGYTRHDEDFLISET